MKRARTAAALAGWLLAFSACAAPSPLQLRGYADDAGAISVLFGGDSVDPYFALQALLLAHENGMSITVPAEKFVEWLLPRQKPDGTFDRFCKAPGRTWTSCKTADADDSLLAMWIKLLETMPALTERRPAWKKSYATSVAALEHLFQPSRGIYMVSPTVLHGLFMDNLEVWSYKVHSKRPERVAEAGKLAQAIQETFWSRVDKRYIVSTQLEQRSVQAGFYPDHVAQLFPLLVGFPAVPEDAAVFYQRWMRQHRAEWLAHGEHDYPWGIIAVLALRQNDRASALCWISGSGQRRHSARWAVTDETAYQILLSKGLTPAAATANCPDGRNAGRTPTALQGNNKKAHVQKTTLLITAILLAGGQAWAQTDPNSSRNISPPLPPLPAGETAVRALELSAGHQKLTNGFGNWSDVTARGTYGVRDHVLQGELSATRRFDSSGVFFGVSDTYTFNPDWYGSLGVGAGDGAFYLPRFRADASISRKFLKDRSLVGTFGLGYYRAPDGHTDRIVRVGGVYYFPSSWIVEGGINFNTSNPGSVKTQQQFVAATWGADKKDLVTGRYMWGGEGYQTVGTSTQLMNFRSREATLSWRHWLNPQTGVLVGATRYTNPFYRRSGINAGVFHNF